MATITMTDIEYNQMLSAKADCEKQIADLKNRLIEAQSQDADGRITSLITAMGAARSVIGFAVAHLPPEAYKGWPYEQLRQFAQIMNTSPVPYDWTENAIDLIAFARETERYEIERANRPTQTRTELLEKELAELRAQLNAQHAEAQPVEAE